MSGYGPGYPAGQYPQGSQWGPYQTPSTYYDGSPPAMNPEMIDGAWKPPVGGPPVELGVGDGNAVHELGSDVSAASPPTSDISAVWPPTSSVTEGERREHD
jgi:hypothetical protein